MILGGMLTAIMLGFAGQILLEAIRPAESQTFSENALLVEGLTTLAILVLMVVLLFVRSRPLNRVFLALLVALNLLAAFGRSAL